MSARELLDNSNFKIKTQYIPAGASNVDSVSVSAPLSLTGTVINPIVNVGFVAKGDLIAGTGANTGTVLTAGANGTYLAANSATASGLQWVSPSPSLTGSVVRYVIQSPTPMLPVAPPTAPTQYPVQWVEPAAGFVGTNPFVYDAVSGSLSYTGTDNVQFDCTVMLCYNTTIAGGDNGKIIGETRGSAGAYGQTYYQLNLTSADNTVNVGQCTYCVKSFSFSGILYGSASAPYDYIRLTTIWNTLTVGNAYVATNNAFAPDNSGGTLTPNQFVPYVTIQFSKVG